MQLSHSSIDLYNMCPQAWYLKYIQKYRETTISSALFFGTAVGTTWQQMVLKKKEVLTEEEKKIVNVDPYEFFDSLIVKVELNGEMIDLPTSTKARYFKGDYDPMILTPEDLRLLDDYRHNLGYVDEISFQNLYDLVICGEGDEDDQSLLNFHFWLSVRRKGHLLIKEYANAILPKIIKVYDLEKQINLDNGQGDTIIGYIDMICEFETDEGIKKILFDHKTSSAKYKKTAIQDSQQLSLYTYAEEIDLVGYIVGVKKVKNLTRGSRKGEIHTEIQVIYESIPEDIQEGFIELADKTLTNIKEDNFEKNEEHCLRFFGKRCTYYDLCYNNDDSNLFKKEE